MWRRLRFAVLAFLLFPAIGPLAHASTPRLTAAIDESRLVPLEGNTPPAALDPRNDRGRINDDTILEHLHLVLARDPAVEQRLARQIDAMHTPGSPVYHHWLTAQQLGAEYGAAAADVAVIRRWLSRHGFHVNGAYRSGFVIDFSGTAGQVREAFHTELHALALPNGEQHVSNIGDPMIPAALAPVVQGIATLHDFRPRPRAVINGAVGYDRATHQWHPHFTLPSGRQTYEVVGPYDFATIYNLIPLWQRGYTGKGVVIAVVEDTNLAHPSDWSSFRATFGMDKFTLGSFEQIYPQSSAPDPKCKNPGQNGDEVEAALDAEWASASAPDAKVELVACANTKTTAGLDAAILNLLDSAPPDIISDSYGLCETVSGAAEVALENLEAQQAAAEGVTFFIAQGDDGADQCVSTSARYASTGINSGDNTASAYAVDVGGTDFMAQYNADVNGIPVSQYWNAVNNPRTLQSALSYVPEIPWNDSCASRLVYTDPVYGAYKAPYGADGFCNTRLAQKNYFVDVVAGSGEASTCFTGKPSIPGVVSGTCKGNPKPSWQTGVPGIPNDGLRDQPDIALFAGNGAWGSYYVECLSDKAQGGEACNADNDAFLGGGGTSFAAPAMAGIQALIDQKFGRQGNANYVYYALAARQFAKRGSADCNASSTKGKLPAGFCIFNDIQLGDNDIPCGQTRNGQLPYDCYGNDGALLGVLSRSTASLEPAYKAGVGYDFPTGLGSINASRLFDAWPRSK
jgi:subtilase family serine protease